MNHSISVKILTVFAAMLLLITAMAIPAAAADDTQVTITIESGSEVYTPDPSSVTINAGETYTFSLPDNLPTTLTDEYLGEYEVSFSCWRFTGGYEVIEGTVNEDGESPDKTVTLRPMTDLKAVACFYEDNALFYMVNVMTNNPDYVPYAEQGECPKGENWTFSVPDELDGFERWEFSGDYEVVEGTVDENGYATDRTVVLKPKGHLDAYARFVEEEATEPGAGNATEATKDQTNKSGTSPQTGDKLPLFVGALALAVVTGLFAVKKIRE